MKLIVVHQILIGAAIGLAALFGIRSGVSTANGTRVVARPRSEIAMPLRPPGNRPERP